MPVCVREKVDHTLTQCSTKPKPLHLSAFMRVHIFFFFVLSTSFFFVLKLYSNSPSIFLSVSAGSHQSPFPHLTVLWFIAKRLCLLWNCAYFNLHLDFSLLSHSVPTIPLIFFFDCDCLSPKLKRSHTLGLLYLSYHFLLDHPSLHPLTSGSFTLLPSVIVSSCSSAACWKEREEREGK